MKALSVFRRCLRQNIRDRFGLALTVLTAPFFVLFYWGVFGDSVRAVDVCIDGPKAVVTSVQQQFGADAHVAVTRCSDAAGTSNIVVTATIGDLPERGPLPVTFGGNASDSRFQIGVAQLQIALDGYVATERGEAPRVAATVEPFGKTDALSAFDLYVPNLLIFALIMLVFSTAMSVAREIERGTLERLRLTRMRTRDYLAGVAASQLVIGAVSIVCTLGVALALGFSPSGSIATAAAVALGGAIACIGVGVLTAAFARTVSRAFVISSFFMFLLVLFSGLVFPTPDLLIFDIIPTVHAARALNDVLLLGASMADVSREMAFLAILASISFVAGGVRFFIVHRSFVQEEA
jgi:ABC-2 type transport system permease protein